MGFLRVFLGLGVSPFNENSETVFLLDTHLPQEAGLLVEVSGRVLESILLGVSKDPYPLVN